MACNGRICFQGTGAQHWNQGGCTANIEWFGRSHASTNGCTAKAEYLSWTRVLLLPFTKRRESEKDVMDRHPYDTLALVELVLWCLVDLHCLNILALPLFSLRFPLSSCLLRVLF